MSKNLTNYSGFTADAPEHLALDSAAVFRNFTYGTDTYATAVAAGKLLGTTQGGVTFSAVPQTWTPQLDGLKVDGKGLQFITKIDVSVKMNVITMTTQTMKDALMAADLDPDDFYDKLTGRFYVDDTDYIDNVTIVGKIFGSEKPYILQVFNVLNMTGLVSNFVDNTAAVIPVDFKGHVDLSSVTTRDTVPYTIYRPKYEGTVSGYISTGARAQGTLTVDTEPTVTADTMTIGGTTYTFRASLANAGDIALTGAVATTQANIVAAINGTDGVNTPNASVTAGDFAADDCILTAIVPGTVGNAIATTETFTAATNIFDAGVLGTTTAGVGAVVAAGATATITIDSETFVGTSIAGGTFEIDDVPYGTGYTVAAASGALTGSSASLTVVGGVDTDAGNIIVS